MGWFKEVLIVSLIQGHTHDLIDGEFANWSVAERKRNIISFFGLKEFLSHAFIKKKVGFIILRKLFDWTSYFEDTFTDFSQYSNARLFKFSKNESGEVVMMYKTNPLETDWRGFTTPNSSKQYGVQVCKSYLEMPPHLIFPEPLLQNTLDILNTSTSVTKYYNSQDATFWENLQHDSTSYLQNNELFPYEGIVIEPVAQF